MRKCGGGGQRARDGLDPDWSGRTSQNLEREADRQRESVYLCVCKRGTNERVAV